MKVLLIGSDGQLGSDLAKSCPKGINLIKSTIADLDITNSATVEKRIGSDKPDLVINTAAYVKVDEAEEAVKEVFLLNSIAVGYLSMACSQNNCNLVHFGTDFVFDGEKGKPYIEKDTPNPLNIYGLTKWTGEVFALNYCPKCYLVRLAYLYGRVGAQGKGSNIVYAILKKAREEGTIKAIDDLFISPTYSSDAAVGIWRLVQSNKPFGVYHMTNRGVCSLYQFAQAIVEEAGLKAAVVPIKHDEYKTKAQRPLFSALASSKGTQLRPWREALADFILSISVN